MDGGNLAARSVEIAVSVKLREAAASNYSGLMQSVSTATDNLFRSARAAAAAAAGEFSSTRRWRTAVREYSRVVILLKLWEVRSGSHAIS